MGLWKSVSGVLVVVGVCFDWKKKVCGRLFVLTGLVSQTKE